MTPSPSQGANPTPQDPGSPPTSGGLPPFVPDTPDPAPSPGQAAATAWPVSPMAPPNDQEPAPQEIAQERRVRPSDLAGILRTLSLGNRTGTLKVSGDEGQLKYLYFRQGILELLKTPRAKTLIGKALIKCRKITAEDLRNALSEQRRREGEKLGHVLRHMGLASAEDVQTALTFQIAEEVFDLFTWRRVRGEFIRGDPPLDIFDSDDLAERMALNPIDLAEEAEQRVAHWHEIRQIVPSLHDVYSPTPDAQDYAKRQPEGSPEVEILGHIDGVRDVTEILEQVALPDSTALYVMARLVQQGALVPLNALQLFGIAEACEHDRQLAKALRLYSRSEELGLESNDLCERMARVHLALGDIDRAVTRYLKHADVVTEGADHERAVTTLSRVLEIAPDRPDVRKNLVKALIASGREEEAITEYESLAEAYAVSEDSEQALHSWQEIVRLDGSHLRARGEVAAIFIQRGDVGFAIPELEELTAEYLNRGENSDAISVMQKILELDPECLSANMQLATTLTHMGETEQAINQYLKFAQTLQDGGLVTDHTMATLVGVYERIVELNADHTDAREWLAKAYLERDEISKAIAHYEEKARSQRSAGDHEDLIETLQKLGELAPDRTDAARELSRTLAEVGRRDEAIKTFHEIAEAAVKRKDYDGAMATYEEVLLQNPFDLDAHRGLANVLLLQKDHPAATLRFLGIGEMCMAAALNEDAESAFRSALEMEPERAELRARLASVLERLGREEEAAREHVRAAKFFINDEENFGLAKKALRIARKLDPRNEDALDLQDSLERRRSTTTQARFEEQPPAHQPAPTTTAATPTITGGAREHSVPTITGAKGSHKVHSIAERLKGLKLGPSGPPPEAAATSNAASSPEIPSLKTTRSTMSALSKLKALKGGGAEASTGSADQPAKTADSGGTKTTGKLSGLAKLKALKSGASTSPDQPTESADSGTKTTGKLSGLAKLKALKGGNSTPEPKASDEAATEASETAPRVSSGLDGLKALASGSLSQGADASADAADAMAALEAAMAAADAAVAAADEQETLSVSPSNESDPQPEQQTNDPSPPDSIDGPTDTSAYRIMSTTGVAEGPESSGEPQNPPETKKTMSALQRLKALKGGGSAGKQPASNASPADDDGKTVSSGPEGGGSTAAPKASKKTLSALGKLKALKKGN